MGDSVNNLPNNPAVQLGHSLTPTQQSDLDQLNSLSADANAASASGDKNKAKADAKQINSLLHKLSKDGFSKEDVKSVTGQLNVSGLSSSLVSGLKSGSLKASDPKAANTLQADYQAFLAGKNWKASDDAWNQFSQSITPSLKSAGLSDDDTSKLLGKAKTAQIPPMFSVNNLGSRI